MTQDSTGFVHVAHACRVVFRAGAQDDVAAELAALGGRPLLVATASAWRSADRLLAELAAGSGATIPEARQHVPREDAEAARALARATRCDCLVAVGGGSAIGLAKAVALTERLPILAVPTTYSGSEMTAVWGLTEGGVKTIGRDPAVAPRTVVYDPRLTASLPAALTAASGLNALAHAVDALWAPGRSPLTDLVAAQAVATLTAALPHAVRDGDVAAREAVLRGAWLAGTAFGVTGSSVHHKLCHLLGGRFGVSHADTHAVLLPWTAQLGLRRSPEVARRLQGALGGAEPVAALRELCVQVGALSSLAQLGLTAAQAASIADGHPPDGWGTPFRIAPEELQQLLTEATEGRT